MSLSAVAYPPYETIRGVRFAMLGGTELVAVLVARDALEEIEVPRSTKARCLDRFRKHRHTFEQIASSKHRRGQVELSGVVIVRAGDVRYHRA